MPAGEAKAGIKPEVLAAIAAAVAMYGYSVDKGYQINNVTKCANPWKRAGLMELMMGRKMNRDFL